MFPMARYKVPITFDLISQITSFPKVGVNPSQYFRGKDNDIKLVARLKNKYDVVRDKHAYVISTINGKAVGVAAKILTVNIVHKNRPN